MKKIEIPFRLPSLNQYINECRENRYAGAKMKKSVEEDIGWDISQAKTELCDLEKKIENRNNSL